MPDPALSSLLEHADTFRRDFHPDLRADYVLANPPIKDSRSLTIPTDA